MKNMLAGFGAVVVVALAVVAVMAAAGTSATTTPSLVMTDSYGYVWSLRPDGAVKGVQQYSGVLDVDTALCGEPGELWAATATISRDGAGVWTWHFTATNPSFGSNTCFQTFTEDGTGIGHITGTWTSTGPSLSDSWTGEVSKGPGAKG